MVTWNAVQLGQFLARCEGNRYRSLYLVLATTGMRRGEALGLQWGDVDLDERRFSIVRSTTLVDHRIVTAARTKTGRGRRVDLDEPTVAALRAHRAWQAQELLALGLRVDSTTPVFCLPTGDPYNPERVSREFSRMLDRNPDLPRIRLHDLRHTWATLALGAGVPVKVVSERRGHATSAITMDIYSHVTPTMQQDAASKVAGLIFPGSGIL